MAVITPQSDVYLIKVPLEIDNNNQLTFTDATAQYNYFNSLPKIAFDDFTYQRKDGVLRIPALFDDIINYNYVMYRNDAYSNKWFYAYITGMEYVNDAVTNVSIMTDVWQTWQFDLSFKKTFVEREHVNDDTVGLHTVPEGLETGEYVKNYSLATPELKETIMLYCVGVSDVVGTLNPMPASTINGLPNGLYYIFTDNAYDLHAIAGMYDKAGKADAIYTMFVFPKNVLFQSESTYHYQSAEWSYTDSSTSILIQDLYVPTSSTGVANLTTNYQISKPTKVGITYTPKNNKLLTFPFCYLNVSNNNGTTVEYRYEDFDGNPTFNVDGVLCIGCSTKLYPVNYKNFRLTGDNTYDYGINGGKYPTISWKSDSFTNWITQNSVNMNADVGIRTFGALAQGLQFGGAEGFASAGATFLSGIMNNIKNTQQASRMPDQAKGNLNVGDLIYSKNKEAFTFLPMSIKPEYAKICDDYFSMFGYKVNEVKVPNITGRRNWNYVKTVGCYIEADIPQEDLQEIKLMFDRGITFWHNTYTFCDYNQNNDII